MRILLHRADGNTGPWIEDFARHLPEARVEVWSEEHSQGPYDYAVVWSPPQAMLAQLAQVKAIFLTGAGVDALMRYNDDIPAHIPVIRLEDAGMAAQMAEYVSYAVLRYFRRLDEYEAQSRAGVWQPLAQHERADFSVGVLGMGVLGSRVLDALKPLASRCAAGAAVRNRSMVWNASTVPTVWIASCAVAACWCACCR